VAGKVKYCALSNLSKIKPKQHIHHRNAGQYICKLTICMLSELERKDSIGSVDEGGVPGCAIDYLTVDENQRTIQSNFSVNTQDSAIFEHAPLQCGNIRFVKDTVDLIYEVR
jgi:hypothetical protein